MRSCYVYFLKLYSNMDMSPNSPVVFTGWKAQYIYMKVKDAQPNNIWNFNRFLAQLSPTERSKVYKDMISQDRAKLSVVFNRAI